METTDEQRLQREDEFHWAFETVWRAVGRPSYNTILEIFVEACGSTSEVADVHLPLLAFMRQEIESGTPLNWFSCKADEFSFDEAVRQGKVARAALLQLLDLPPEESATVAS